MSEKMNPLLSWLFEQRGDIPGKVLLQKTGISSHTLSRTRQGKQDMTTDFFWRFMLAIAELKPFSDCARMVAVVQKNEPIPDLKRLVANASEEELKVIMQYILDRAFDK